MNNAYELFTAVPRKHNCAQAVADGFGNKELAAAMQSCGGGNAPNGYCGALYAALCLTDQAKHAELIAEFVETAHAAECKKIKANTRFVHAANACGKLLNW